MIIIQLLVPLILDQTWVKGIRLIDIYELECLLFSWAVHEKSFALVLSATFFTTLINMVNDSVIEGFIHAYENSK